MSEIHAISDFLLVVHDAHVKLRRFAIDLRKRDGVLSSDHALDIERPTYGVSVEDYVKAELESGDALSWRLGIECSDGGFAVSSDVSRIQSHGSSRLVTILDDRAASFETLRALVEGAVVNLCEAPSAYFDLFPPTWQEIAQGKVEWSLSEVFARFERQARDEK